MKFGMPIVLLLVAGSCLASASSRDKRERGAAIYQANGCQHCHMMGNVGGHRGPNLSDVGKRTSKSAMRKQIVYGSKLMPAFGDVLASGEIKDLIYYLHSCREKPTPSSAAPGSGQPSGN
jgi:mono/diheme cytochrome c family protein